MHQEGRRLTDGLSGRAGIPESGSSRLDFLLLKLAYRTCSHGNHSPEPIDALKLVGRSIAPALDLEPF